MRIFDGSQEQRKMSHRGLLKNAMRTIKTSQAVGQVSDTTDPF